MKLQLVRHLWGLDCPVEKWEELGPSLQKAGYSAIETSFRHIPPEVLEIACGEYGFGWVPQVFSRMFVPGGTVQEHLDSLREQIEECLEAKPLFFNGHTGSDAWEFSQAVEFFAACVELEKEYGIKLCHETHRMRWMSLPWRTRDVLKEVPNLKVTADFSHWVCVCERFLEDIEDIIQLTAEHTHHVHARVGFPEGPQVADPRVKDSEWALKAHEAWWEIIWRAQQARGVEISSLTPEFGPPPYLHTDPATGKPLVNLADVCDWMAERQSKHFDAWISLM